jgi:hypothetical protein
MVEELSNALKIGRLEDKFELYEPALASLGGLVSVPDTINKIYEDLQFLRESRIEMKGKLSTLLKDQDKFYRDTVKMLEKEIEECPIKNVAGRLLEVERSIILISGIDGRLVTAEKVIESFKLKGWDLLFRIVPWIIAAVTTGWAVFR